MHEQYLAALDRLRQPRPTGLDDQVRDSNERMAAILTVYDFEHDTTPATVEWLNSLPEMPCHVEYTVRLSGTEIAFVADCGDIKLPNPTRGDVLSLLRVFAERNV